jgi:type VI secretion system protein ImpG
VKDLLGHYNEELRALRELATPFAAAHPKIAGRLRLAGDMVEDPFVGRLLEGVALLNARIAQRLDDDFLPFAESLMATLAPHLMQPVPSMTVLAFEPALPTSARQTVPAGFPMDSEAVRDQHCRFRTSFPVDIWPVRLHAAQLQGAPFDAPVRRGTHAAVLRLTFESVLPDVSLESIGLDRIRLFIKADSQRAFQIHELLFGCTNGVSYAVSSRDDHVVHLGKEAIEAVGYLADEMLLGSHGDPGSKLLLEHFVFPEKYLFFDLAKLDYRLLRGTQDRLSVYIYLDRTDTALERSLSASDFSLFATPAVNLFERECEPARVDVTRHSQRVVADARREQAIEIQQLLDVSLLRSDGSTRPCSPLHAPASMDQMEATHLYSVARQASPLRTGGTDVHISLANRSGDFDLESDDVLSIKALCFNRDLPQRLPFGGGKPSFYPVAGDRAVRSISCLVKPTSSLPAPAGKEAAWRLAALLNLNHLHLESGAAALQSLKSLIALLDLRQSPQSLGLMRRLVSLNARPSLARVPVKGLTAFCNGLDVALTFDDDRLSGSGSFLFGCVLEHFLSGFVPANSFVRSHLSLVSDVGSWKQGVALCGQRALS